MSHAVIVAFVVVIDKYICISDVCVLLNLSHVLIAYVMAIGNYALVGHMFC